jgi:hypothetical protein
MTFIPASFDALLTRDRTAKALTEAGFRIASPTLATKATRGGGPVFRLFNGRAIYRWGDALRWAESKLSAPRRSTSEGDIRDTGDVRPIPAVRGANAIAGSAAASNIIDGAKAIEKQGTTSIDDPPAYERTGEKHEPPQPPVDDDFKRIIKQSQPPAGEDGAERNPDGRPGSVISERKPTEASPHVSQVIAVPAPSDRRGQR